MIEAAQKVFAKRGYENATLDEIADEAEFGKGTLYNYFEGGKEGILFAVLDNLYNEIKEHLEDTMADDLENGDPFRDRYQSYVIESFEFFEEREELFLLLIKEINRLAFDDDAKRLAYFRQQQQDMVAIIIPMIERAMDQNEIKQLPPDAVAYMLIENLNGMLMHRAMVSQLEPSADTLLHKPNEAAQFLTTMLFDGLRNDNGTEEADITTA